MLLEIQKINIGARARAVTDARVDFLIKSIAVVGLLNPVTVVKEMVIRGGQSVDGYTLVAGAHRLEAMRRRGDTEIEATVVDLDKHERRLAECDENLCGANLSFTERATLTVIRKECYEFLYPETVHGGDRKSSRKVCDLIENRFTQNTADKTNRAERTVQLDVERGEKILPGVMAKISGTILDTGIFLDEIKVLPGGKQMIFLLNRLKLKGPSAIKNPGPKAKAPPDLPRLKRLSTALNDALKAAAPETRSLYYEWQGDTPA